MDGRVGVIIGARSLVLLRAGQNEATLSQLSPVSMKLFVETRKNASTTRAPRVHRRRSRRKRRRRRSFLSLYAEGKKQMHNVSFISRPLHDSFCLLKQWMHCIAYVLFPREGPGSDYNAAVVITAAHHGYTASIGWESQSYKRQNTTYDYIVSLQSASGWSRFCSIYSAGRVMRSFSSWKFSCS